MAAPGEEIDEFGLARKRSKQQAQANLQQKQQALKRRFAVLGTGASGARIKAEERAQSEFGENVQAAEEQIGTAERAENRRKREIEQAREFQTSERVGSQEFARGERLSSQDFAGDQANIARQFATAERLGSQAFVGAQQELQRKFATGERISSQEFASAEQELGRVFVDKQREAQELFAAGESEKARQVQKDMFAAQMDLDMLKFGETKRQFEATFGEEVRINDKNIEFAERMLAAQEQGGIFDGKSDGFSFEDALVSVVFGLGDPVTNAILKKTGNKTPLEIMKGWSS